MSNLIVNSNLLKTTGMGSDRVGRFRSFEPGASPVKKPRALRILKVAAGAVVALILSCTIAYVLWVFLRPQPAPMDYELFTGIHYWREVRIKPRPLVIHRLEINLKVARPQFVISAGDPSGTHAARAIRTSTFLQGSGCQIAINGGFYRPIRHRWSFMLEGEPVDLFGLAATQGDTYSPAHSGFETLFLSADNLPSFGQPLGPIYNAISGGEMILRNGKLSTFNENETSARTAIGLDATRTRLLIVIVDGKQVGYSEGVTVVELASILRSWAIVDALCLDGGGSSTLAVRDASDHAKVLNMPTNLGIVGLERPVANCLGMRLH